ncbi:hypothetical protein Bca52824_008945 [Brassica carinata]|uniref:Glycoprotease 1 n=1 Tax=Brassica carinata TaxID=52824 RepID=A0A8X8B9Q3_BRACI|nr:hypothetical protein Bca52824_008945 [Brassica carinata]
MIVGGLRVVAAAVAEEEKEAMIESMLLEDSFEDLLNLNLKTSANVQLKSHTVDEIREAVRRDNKQRFSLVEEDGELLIALTKATPSRRLNPTSYLNQYCHGRSSRHERDVNVLIFLDIKKALEDGIAFYISDNKVILTEGVDGVVPVDYFHKIESWLVGSQFLSDYFLWTTSLTYYHQTMQLRTRSCSTGTRVSSLPKIESSKLDDGLVVLGIETSCDDTAAAVVRGNGEILSQVISSQAELLAQYGGVAPKQAEEAHSRVIDKVVQDALDRANVTEKDLCCCCYHWTWFGPLSTRELIGVQKARRVAGAFNLPIVGVHHMEAHALVARLVEHELSFPFMALLISGGHNIIVLAHKLGQYTQLGTTVDDAIGEAFDKTAKWLGLDMRRSGGPAVEELALEGDSKSVMFNVPMKNHKDCNFSYAGLKTQVRLAIAAREIDAKCPVSSATKADRRNRADIAASFQRVAVLHLEEKCERAIDWALKLEPSIKHMVRDSNIKRMFCTCPLNLPSNPLILQVVSGGVASNQYVRFRLNNIVENKNLKLVCPPPSLCTDNGVMVAWTGLEHFRVGRFDPPPPAMEPDDFMYDIRPRWPLGEEYAQGRSEARSMRTARVHPSLTSIIRADSLQQQTQT